MLSAIAVPLILLFAAPEASEPERVFQQIVADLRKQDFMAVWNGLGPEAQKALGRGLRDKVGAADDADMRKVIAAWKAKMAARESGPLDTLTKLQVEVTKVDAKPTRATLTVRSSTPGFPRSGLVVMVKHQGKWLLDDLKQPGEPNVGERTARANELGAIATLRNLVAAQAQFQAVGVVDGNQNGVGEYGTFAEMAGAVALRGGKNKINPPVLSPRFAKPKKGRLTLGGYHFRLYLPGAKGIAIGEHENLAKLDVNLAEVVWCAYAWPVEAGKTGKRAFFVNQMGDVLYADAAGYGGDKEPSPYAAFAPGPKGKPAGSMAADLAPGKKASDGRVWKFGR